MKAMATLEATHLRDEIRTLERALFTKRSALKSLDLVGEAPQRSQEQWRERLDVLAEQIAKHSRGGDAIADVRAMRDAE